MNLNGLNSIVATAGLIVSIDALGISSGASIDPLDHEMLTVVAPASPPPKCTGTCSPSTTVPKEKTDAPPSPFCQLLNADYDYFEGYCQKYVCSNGYYYTGPFWTWGECVPDPIYWPPCPGGTCVP